MVCRNKTSLKRLHGVEITLFWLPLGRLNFLIKKKLQIKYWIKVNKLL